MVNSENKHFSFLVQLYERCSWRTKLDTTSLDEAYEYASRLAYRSLERVRVVRVDQEILVSYYYTNQNG